MLSKATTTTMLPVSDVDRASDFYTARLGLHLRMTAADGTASSTRATATRSD